MRISKIKAFSDDYKVRGAISRFWEIEEYRKALETHNQEDCTIFKDRGRFLGFDAGSMVFRSLICFVTF